MRNWNERAKKSSWRYNDEVKDKVEIDPNFVSKDEKLCSKNVTVGFPCKVRIISYCKNLHQIEHKNVHLTLVTINVVPRAYETERNTCIEQCFRFV